MRIVLFLNSLTIFGRSRVFFELGLLFIKRNHNTLIFINNNGHNNFSSYDNELLVDGGDIICLQIVILKIN